MNPAQLWWLENTAQGRRLQRRILPRSAWGPRLRAEVADEEREQERREQERQRQQGRRS